MTLLFSTQSRVAKRLPSAALVVQAVAVFAQPVAVGARPTFIRRDVTTGRTGAVVVVDAMLLRLLHFIYGMEFRDAGHSRYLLTRLSNVCHAADLLATVAG